MSLDVARSAHQRYAWTEGYEAFGSQAVSSPEDLSAFADCAFWCGKLDEAMKLREEAFSGFLEAGRSVDAAGVALLLGYDHIAKGEQNLAFGRIAQAQQLLKDQSESPVHGFLASVLSFRSLLEGDVAGALEQARSSLEIAEQFGDMDGLAEAHVAMGRANVAGGEVDEGLRHLNEAIVPAISGQLGPYSTGATFCDAVSACSDLGEYRKAGEWSEAAKRWGERQESQLGFPGACRIHRAEVMRLRGNWSEALSEAMTATNELMEFNFSVAALGFYEIGLIRLKTGDYPAAEESFTRAHELGLEPQPGLAMLRLMQGKPEAAASALRRSLDDLAYLPQQPMGGSPSFSLRRARLLLPQVEVAIATADLDLARGAAGELSEIAQKFGPAALRAAAAHAHGLVEAAEGDHSSAGASFRKAIKLWQEADAPYEAARARVELGKAYAGEGDEEAASMELKSAAAIFERLGAIPDLEPIRGGAAAVRMVKTFMFTDIVRSTNLLEAMGEEAWEDLLGWHDSTLRSLFAEFEGEEVKQVGDGFIVAFETPHSAIDCAMAIQKRLAEHRKSSGFAPQVRIGLHATDTTRKSGDYQGRGIHAAARVGALAEGGEILASLATVDGDYSVSEPREVQLKGITEPIEVVSITWR